MSALESLKVAEVMTREVFVLKVDTQLFDAASQLATRGVSAAPVIGANGKPLGLVSRTDLADPHRDNRGSTIEGVMTHLLYAVHPHDSVQTAVDLMVRENVHRVVVVDLEGELAGMLTAMDVMRALASEPGVGNQRGDVE